MRPLDRGIAKAYVLKLLSNGPLHGYGIMKKLRDTLGFAPSPGHIYMLLRRLEKEGLVCVETPAVSGRRIRVYRLTDKGKRFLEDNRVLVDLAEQYVERLRKAKDIGLHKVLKVVRDVFYSIDALTNDKVDLLRRAVDDFIKRVEDVLGG